MNLNQTLKLLEKEVDKLFLKPTSDHDVYHFKRVTQTALKIQKTEGGDKETIIIAAFLHDIHRMMRNPRKKYLSPKQSLPVVKKILKKVDLPDDKLKSILKVIEVHEEYSFSKRGKKRHDLETQIVQEKTIRKHYDEAEEIDTSQIEHLHVKVLKLYKDLNTKTAKKLAQSRHKFVKNYLKQFYSEWKGEI